ncbi:MAG: VOC family protein [Acidimicrobiia bacterium]
MTMVEGLGGVFIDSHDARALADWYRQHLEIDFQEHPEGGSFFVVFHSRDATTGEIRQNPVFAINQSKSDLAEPAHRGLVVNLRVGDLDRAMQRLTASGVEVEDRRITWEGGKHGWIRDLDGNKVELYEELTLPPDSQYRAG